jgi:hypothetical protein
MYITIFGALDYEPSVHFFETLEQAIENFKTYNIDYIEGENFIAKVINQEEVDEIKNN